MEGETRREGERERGASGTEQAEPTESRRPAHQPPWLEAVPGGQPTLLGDQVLGEPGPSHSHFLSLCQHLRPHSYSWTALGVLQKK